MSTPVAEYLLREGSGTTVHDTAGSNTGTITPGATAPTWVSQGLQFNGGFQYVLLPDTLLANDDTTIVNCSLEVWVKLSSVAASGQAIDLSDLDLFLGVQNNSFNPLFTGQSWSSGGSHLLGEVFSSSAPATGVWVHYVYVRNGLNHYLYKNGSLDNSATSTDATTAVDLRSSVGSKNLGACSTDSGFTASINGILGEARIYNVALSSSDVLATYNASSPRYTGATLSINNSSPLPAGVLNASYSVTFTASGAAGALTWSVLSGSLPPGLSLNASTGVLSGTCTAAGVYAFTIQVTDGTSTVHKDFTLTVSPPPAAAFTFNFLKTFLSYRTSGAPGAGVWSTPARLFDSDVWPTATNGSSCNQAKTFSSGSQTTSDHTGMISDSDHGLLFCGDGLATQPIYVDYPGRAGNVDSYNYWDCVVGAWTYNSALYAVAGERNAGLVVIKSTNGGGNWTALDRANAPPSVGTFVGNVIVRMQNNVLYVFLLVNPSNPDYALYSFSFATDKWTGPFAPITLSGSMSPADRTDWSNGIYRYSNGDIGVVYATAPNYLPVYRLWNGTAWGSEVSLPGVRCAQTIPDPGGTYLHVFTYSIDSLSDTVRSAVHYSKVTHAGSVTPDIFIIPRVLGTGSDGVGNSIIQNSLILVPRDDSNDFTNAVWVADYSNPSTFYKELLPAPQPYGMSITAASVGAAGSGYAVGDTGTVNGGTSAATYQVTSVSAGQVTGVILTARGAGYSTGAHTTTATSGSGTGLGINVLHVDGIGTFTINTPGSGYNVGDTIQTASGGATGTVTSVGGGGAVTGVNWDFKGSGFTAGSNVSVSNGGNWPGSGFGLTIHIVTLTGIVDYTLDNPTIGSGTGYVVGDSGTIDINGGLGGIAGQYIVSAVDAHGGVTAFTFTGGGGYAVGLTTTTRNSGSGSGFVVDILTVAGSNPSCAYMFFPFSGSPPPPSGRRMLPQYIKRRHFPGH